MNNEVCCKNCCKICARNYKNTFCTFIQSTLDKNKLNERQCIENGFRSIEWNEYHEHEIMYHHDEIDDIIDGNDLDDK